MDILYRTSATVTGGRTGHEINTTYVDLRVNEGIRGLLHSQRTMGVDARRTGWAALI